MNLRIALAALLMAATLSASDDVRCRSHVVFPASKLSVTVPFERTHNGIFVRARLNDRPEPLWFVIDSGAPRTIISPAAARGGVALKTSVITIGDVTIDRIDLRIADLSVVSKMWGRRVDGVIGYDLLCRTVLRVDYDTSRVTLTHPAVFQYAGNGAELKLNIRHGWSFVEGTIKVTGRPAVIDTFMLDSGSPDAVNHPIIRDSKGPLRKISTAGVLGPTEWFQIGKYTVGSTQATCCSSMDNNRQIGAELLSRFHVTFDYPHRRLILERATR
jgi:hypothetical protein